MRRIDQLLCCWAAVLAFSAPVRAQEAVGEDRKRMMDGFDAYAQSKYARAATLLTEVLSRVPRPTVAYYAGRANEQLGKLVEAAALYRRAAGLPAPGTGKLLKAEQRAQSDAEVSLAALEPRIPRLTLRIGPESSQGVTVTLDGASVALDALQAPLLLNPGSHQVEATAECGQRNATTSQTVAIAT